MGATAAVIIALREKDLVAHFLRERAVSLETARSLSEMHVDVDRVFRRLQSRAVIREGAPDLFYLDEASWLAVRQGRRRMIMALLAIGVVVAVAVVALRFDAAV